MSKPSPALETLIEAAQSPLLSVQTRPKIQDAIDKIEQEATTKGLDRSPWLAIVTATTMTRGSPASMAAVLQHLISKIPASELVQAAEYMREVGICCLAMNGMLHALRDALPPPIRAALSDTPTRHAYENNIKAIHARGWTLWSQIHHPFSRKLERKFGDAHPDLPHFVIGSVYGNLLTAGRITTSIGSIACLKAQPGLAAQVFDHVCGLKNAWHDGSWKAEPGIGGEEAVGWLLGDEGCLWVLEKVDELVEAIACDEDGGFAHCRSKL